MLPGFVTLRIQSYQDSKNQTINIVAPAQDLRGLANASLFIDAIILRCFCAFSDFGTQYFDSSIVRSV